MHFPSHALGAFGECKGKTWKACRAQTWLSLSQLRDEGYIRDVGVSNFNVRQMEEIQALKAAPIAVNQFQYNPWVPNWLHDDLSFCHRHSIVATAYASLGSFFGQAKTETVATMTGIASAHGKSSSQVLLRWALQKNMSVIPGTGNPKHMRENLEVYSFSLTDGEMSSIDALRSDPSGVSFFFTPEDST